MMRNSFNRDNTRHAGAALCAALVVLCAVPRPGHGQIGVVGPYELGNKTSAFYGGLDEKGVGLAIAGFLKVGGGYEDNLYKSPYIFSERTNGSTAPAKVFGTEVNIPRGEALSLITPGLELGATLGEKQRLRLAALGQFKRHQWDDTESVVRRIVRGAMLGRFKRHADEPLANRTSFSGYLGYRNDITDRFRFDFETEVDVQDGPTALIFGTEDVSTMEEVTRLQGSAVLSVETVRLPFMGRGVTQVAAMARHYNYGPSDLDAMAVKGNDTVSLADLGASYLSINDTLEADYYQLRGRLRHTQGLYKGYSARITLDYMHRTYLHQWAKQAIIAQGGQMGEIPDSVNANPNVDYPHRSQHEYRLYGGVRYDPPHINNARVNFGVQGLWVVDPFEGFYGYDQYGLFGSAMYTPNPKGFLELVFGVKNRTYHRLLANYKYWYNQTDTTSLYYQNVTRDNGEVLERKDVGWWDTRLKKTIVEMSLRGQVPLHSTVALWGNYSLEIENTNRPTGEYLSRSYLSQVFAGGITVFLDLIGPEPHYLIER